MYGVGVKTLLNVETVVGFVLIRPLHVLFTVVWKILMVVMSITNRTLVTKKNSDHSTPMNDS